MKQNELGSLIAALHRTNQLGYPVMIIGAGLPKIYKMLSEEKSYSERLFIYKEIGSLTDDQSKKAIEEGADSLVQVQMATRAGAGCGRCLSNVSKVTLELLKEENN